jgi:RNA polymerase sigma-70 factor (ECF subfamily)
LPDRGQAPPDRALSYDEFRGRLAQFIDELPPNQRIALVLFDSEDFGYEQIAHVLSTTADAVGALLMRARATLRRRLAPLL